MVDRALTTGKRSLRSATLAAAMLAGILPPAPTEGAGAATGASAGARCAPRADPRLDLSPVDREMQRWIDRGACPGGVLAIGRHGRLVSLRAYGRMSAAADAPPMTTDTMFDLASLTKVVGTTSAAAILYDRGLLRLDVPVAHYLPGFGAAPGHAAITVRQLLAHASGLKPPTVPLWQLAQDRAGLLALIDGMPVSPAPGTEYHYRDENFILLGQIVERISGQPLDRFLQANLFGPLRMDDTGFRPDLARRLRIAPTEQDDVLRHRLVQGEVHDENAWVLGGVSGNVGLFSTACDLSRLSQMYLDGGTLAGRRIVARRTIALFTTPQNIPAGSRRALGWDTQGSAGGYAGPLAAPRSISHTGFTGTSIYIDFDRDAFVVLLTNRVNPTRANHLIDAARPAISTAVLMAIDGRRPAAPAPASTGARGQ